MWKYNKGEWSEIYTFAYLLSTGVLYSADRDLNKIENVYFPVIKIIREETQGNKIDYHTGEIIKIYRGTQLLKEVPKEEFEEITDKLLREIPNGERAFEISGINDFFAGIYCEKVKANSNKKEDITLQLQDIHTGISPICGFSIKSYLGSRPTLINPGPNTNFIFSINGCSRAIAEEVNSIETRTKIIDRMNYLLTSGCSIKPIKHSISAQFEENLQFIDTLMPELLQLLVEYEYEYNLTRIMDVVEKLKEINPLGYSNTEIYIYKVKKLLCAFALGLTPEKNWLGAEDANGGYITVKSNGEVVCYHLYNRTDFEEYLYRYTYFERPSTTRFNYMRVYEEDGAFKLKLCLQVRFKENNNG